MHSEISKTGPDKPVPKTPGKHWVKPFVLVLTISRDSFSGSITGFEIAGKSGPPAKV
jgi:hypothetical protein